MSRGGRTHTRSPATSEPPRGRRRRSTPSQDPKASKYPKDSQCEQQHGCTTKKESVTSSRFRTFSPFLCGFLWLSETTKFRSESHCFAGCKPQTVIFDRSIDTIAVLHAKASLDFNRATEMAVPFSLRGQNAPATTALAFEPVHDEEVRTCALTKGPHKAGPPRSRPKTATH